jgi:hypothetical protein
LAGLVGLLVVRWVVSGGVACVGRVGLERRGKGWVFGEGGLGWLVGLVLVGCRLLGWQRTGVGFGQVCWLVAFVGEGVGLTGWAIGHWLVWVGPWLVGSGRSQRQWLSLPPTAQTNSTR